MGGAEDEDEEGEGGWTEVASVHKKIKQLLFLNKASTGNSSRRFFLLSFFFLFYNLNVDLAEFIKNNIVH